MKVVKWGISDTATLTGEIGNMDIHRMFLAKGQYNKLVEKLS